MSRFFRSTVSIRIEAVLDRLANILKQRLAAQQSPDTEHPGPDTLVAFVERGLRADEHERIMSHLGRCPECRQALALSTEPNELQPALPGLGSRTRLRFPAAMRWASAVAALAVAAGIGDLLYEHQDKRTVPGSTEVRKSQVAERSGPEANQAPRSADALVARAAPKIVPNARGPARAAQPTHVGRTAQLEDKKAKPNGVLGGLVGSSRADVESAHKEDAITVTGSTTQPPESAMAFESRPGTPPNAASSLQIQSKLEKPAPQNYAKSSGPSEAVGLRRNETLSTSEAFGGVSRQS